MCDLVFRQRACNETPNIVVVVTEKIQPTAAMEETAVRQDYIVIVLKRVGIRFFK